MRKLESEPRTEAAPKITSEDLARFRRVFADLADPEIMAGAWKCSWEKMTEWLADKSAIIRLVEGRVPDEDLWLNRIERGLVTKQPIENLS